MYGLERGSGRWSHHSCKPSRSSATNHSKSLFNQRAKSQVSRQIRRHWLGHEQQGRRREVRAADEGGFGRAPWEVLDVPIDADEKTIKKAYRHLALKHHPDINSSPDAPIKFLKISQAYEMLMDRKHGKDYVEQKSRRRHSDWSFHDWYWDFMLQQRHKAHASPPKAKPILREDHLHGQLAGLKRRAAGRRRKPAASYHTESMHENDEASEDEQIGHHQQEDPKHDPGAPPQTPSAHPGGASPSFAFEDSARSKDPAHNGLIDYNEPLSSTHTKGQEVDHSPSIPSEEAKLKHKVPATQTHQEFSSDSDDRQESRSETINGDMGISKQLQGLKRRAARRKEA